MLLVVSLLQADCLPDFQNMLPDMKNGWWSPSENKNWTEDEALQRKNMLSQGDAFWDDQNFLTKPNRIIVFCSD